MVAVFNLNLTLSVFSGFNRWSGDGLTLLDVIAGVFATLLTDFGCFFNHSLLVGMC